MTGIDRSAAPATLAEGSPDPVPALLIGRLAVDLYLLTSAIKATLKAF